MNNKQNHIRGPWRVQRPIDVYINEHLHRAWPIVSKDEGVAVVIMPDEDKKRRVITERRATAALLAQAPELLKENQELRKLVKALKLIMDHKIESGSFEERYHDMVQLINK